MRTADDPAGGGARTLPAMHFPQTFRLRPAALLIAAVAALSLFPAIAMAHPLGNFTINHYAALRVSSSDIDLDVVVDLAEIPAFQERIRIDTNGDGEVTDAEADAARTDECSTLEQGLDLRLDGDAMSLSLGAAGVSFPAGAGGVPTMRTVCEFAVAVEKPFVAGSVITFADTTNVERIGWREIVVLGDGVSIGPAPGATLPSSVDRSHRLTSYPSELLAQPLNVGSVAFAVTGPGEPIPAFVAADAAPIGGPAPSPVSTRSGAETAVPPTAAPSAAVPGGVGGDIPDLFRADLTPLVAIASLLLAVALGAGHALTPGHGKTLMAAYLVGTRGTVRHAAGLGLAVTVSHTAGILVLALLVTGAESVLPAEFVVRTIPVVAALTFVVIGAVMLVTEIRRRRRSGISSGHVHAGPDEAFEAAAPHAHRHEPADGHRHDHPHEPADGHGADQPHGHDHEPELHHRHGGVLHSHMPMGAQTLSWRSLVVLGLAGGIIPSTNALIILLGTIVAGRAAFGIVLVIAFGLGMAIVLGGVGAIMVLARDRLERFPSTSRLGGAARLAPLVAGVVVLSVGLWLTVQAIAGAPTL